MKKILCIVMALAMILTLAACSAQTNADGNEAPTATIPAVEDLTGTDTSKIIGLEDGVLYDFDLITVVDHGSVTLNGDGTITYYPEKGYTGEAKFSFVYSEYVGWSDVCDVTITVK